MRIRLSNWPGRFTRNGFKLVSGIGSGPQVNRKQVVSSRFTLLITVLLPAAVILSIVGAVSVGSVTIKFNETWKIIINHLLPWYQPFDQTWRTATEKIVWDLRLPRVLLGGTVGGILSVAGVAIQASVRNPLAGPYILGISSSAATGAVSVMLLGAFRFLGNFALSIGAFIGAMLGMFMVITIANVKGRVTPVRIVLTGVAISAFFSAVTNFIVHSAKNDEGVRSALFWMIGSFAGARWEYWPLPAVGLILSVVMFMALSRALNAMILGDETAVTLGVNIQTLRMVTVITAALITGLGVAVSGAIAFVGLVVPHVVRVFTGADHKRVLPISLFVGAVYLIWADVLARIIVAPEELSIGIITSLLGAPFFVYLLRKSRYSFGGKSS